MVTHSSTSRPVQCLCMAERTGCPVFTDLWSYVLDPRVTRYISLEFESAIIDTSGVRRRAISKVCMRVPK
jgi:hypothetical protein